MMRFAAACALIAALVLTGCAAEVEPPPPPSGIDLSEADGAEGNGLWLRSGQQLTQIVVNAVRRAGPVRITGSITEMVQPDPEAEPQRGRTITLDFHGTAAAYSATVSAGDVTVEALVFSEGTRVRGNAGFARANPGHPAGAVVCSTGLDPALRDWAPLLDPAALVSSLLAGSGVAASAPAADSETLDVVIGEEGAVAAALVVDRFGPPLPRSFIGADTTGDAELTFSGWGDAVDLGALAEKLPCPAA